MSRGLRPDDRISHYRVVRPLGSGGMGEVYLAHDEDLERDVALKVLPTDMVRNQERVRRFVREAKSTSSLNHPNIVAIYEIGNERVIAGEDGESASDPIHFISMELVTGDTLGDRIRSRETPLPTLLECLVQAAEGLAKAHGAGIVHRDLKPSNIMISDDGYAKVLDFGLAKLLEPELLPGDLSNATTASLQMTGSGALLGTVGYMSPEQIQGKAVDHRSDIFSFGCVLYECVTGERAFRADTDVGTLHQILHQAPAPIEERSPDVPRALQRLIRRCLVRDPDRRLQSMKDLAIELHEIVDEYEALLSPGGSSAAPRSGTRPVIGSGRFPAVLAGIVAVVALVTIVLGLDALLRGSESLSPGEMSPAPPRVTGIQSDVAACALSPDGKYLAYTEGFMGREGLWIRQLATGSSVQLSAAVQDVSESISFSPDGSYVYFGGQSLDSDLVTVYRVPSLGGSPQSILADVDSRLSFSPDGRQACFRRGKLDKSAVVATDLILVDLETGEEEVLLHGPGFTFRSPAWSPSGERIAAFHGDPDTLLVIDAVTGEYEPLGRVWYEASSCAWLPNERGVIVTAQGAPDEHAQIWSVNHPDGVVRRLTADQDSYGDVSVTADGRVLAARRVVWPVSLWSAPVAGEPDPRRLLRSAGGTGGMEMFFDFVDDGHIVATWDGQLQLLDGQGRLFRSVTDTPGTRSFSPWASPGGILFERFTLEEEAHHIWRVDLASGTPSRLTSGPEEHILFSSPHGYIYRVERIADELFIGSVTGQGPRRIPGTSPCAISPDGRWVFNALYEDPSGPRRLVVRAMDTLEPQLEFDLARPSGIAWTPESDAVAHVIRVGESQQIVLQPLDGGQRRTLVRISPPHLGVLGDNVWHSFRWSPDGEQLCLRFWENGVNNLRVVPSSGGEPRPITNFSAGLIYHWDWAPDSRSVYFTAGDLEQDAVLIHDFE